MKVRLPQKAEPAEIESVARNLALLAGLITVFHSARHLSEAGGQILEILVRDWPGLRLSQLSLENSDTKALDILASRPEEIKPELTEDLVPAFSENRPCFYEDECRAGLPLSTSDGPIGLLAMVFEDSAALNGSRQCGLDQAAPLIAAILEYFLVKSELDRAGISQRRALKEAGILAGFSYNNPFPAMNVAADRTILDANPSARRIMEQLGYSPGNPLPPAFQKPIDECLKVEGPSQFEIELRDRIFSMTGVKADKDAIYLYGQDITDRKRHDEKLQLLASVFESTIEGIIVTDPTGKILQVNPAFSAISGYRPEEALGENPRILQSGRHGDDFYREMWESLEYRGRWSGQLWNRRKNGEAYPQWLSISAIKDSRGRTVNYVGIFHDITDIKHKEERIKHRAEHDPLTGLPNRALFYDRLHMSVARARRNKEMVALLFMDLDNFKDVNDSLGHAVGDLLLKEVAKRLVSTLRSEDTVARLGGDEFTAILPDTSGRQEGTQAAGRIIEAISAPINIGEHELHVGVSIGITLYPLDGRDSETLVKNADMAMYRAKNAGRNNYQVFSPNMNAEALKRLEMDRALRKALERQEFVLYYQPKVNLETGRMFGMEALVRWDRPGLGRFAPPDFIPWAEQSGLTARIGEWVLKTACRQTKAWHKAGYDFLDVAVNLSPRHFIAKNLVEMVWEALKESGLPPHHLELEFTESAVVEDVEEAIRIMEDLREMGVRLYMDDFGTGYSSLAFLTRFPIHALKIDRSFVQDIPDNKNDIAIATAIVSMARSLGLQVVAEGVETEAQLRFLHSLECDAIQGYLYSPPLPPEELEKLLAEGRHLPIP